jgi:hypothetical protein
VLLTALLYTKKDLKYANTLFVYKMENALWNSKFVTQQKMIVWQKVNYWVIFTCPFLFTFLCIVNIEVASWKNPRFVEHFEQHEIILVRIKKNTKFDRLFVGRKAIYILRIWVIVQAVLQLKNTQFFLLHNFFS